jgi:hypothetical protein
MRQVVQQGEARFLAEKPDYQDAFRHLIANRDAKLQAMGFTDPTSAAKSSPTTRAPS